MINFIICDDNKYVRELNENMVSKIVMPYDFNYKIYSFERYDSAFKKILNTGSEVKIYILDLELPGKSGIDIAREIRKSDWDSIIIILTSHDELELKLLKEKLLILDFISKFDDYEKRLSETLKMVIEKARTKKVISFKSNKEVHHVLQDDIYYIYKENYSDKSVIITSNNTYTVSESLSSLMSKLDDRFFQTHRACCVNLNKISKVDFKENIIYFNNGTTTDYLSRNYKKSLRNVLWVFIKL